MKVKNVKIHYPTAIVKDQQLRMMGNPVEPFSRNIVAGAGQLVNETDANAYGFLHNDSVNVNVQAESDTYGLGATLTFEASEDINELWRGCVRNWCEMVEGDQTNG